MTTPELRIQADEARLAGRRSRALTLAQVATRFIGHPSPWLMAALFVAATTARVLAGDWRPSDAWLPPLMVAGAYLCAGGGDLSQPAAQRAALLRYHRSDAYGALVLRWAAAYAGGVAVLPNEQGEVPTTTPTRAMCRWCSFRGGRCCGCSPRSPVSAYWPSRASPWA